MQQSKRDISLSVATVRRRVPDFRKIPLQSMMDFSRVAATNRSCRVLSRARKVKTVQVSEKLLPQLVK
jgi:hypothetical protein